MFRRLFVDIRPFIVFLTIFTGSVPDFARAEFYIAPSMGVGIASSQINTRAFGGAGQVRDQFNHITAGLGLALGYRTRIGEQEVDFELETRTTALNEHRVGTRRYSVRRQQVSVAAFTTLLRREGFHAQLGLGAGARRLTLAFMDGANRRSDTDREPFAMISLRGVLNSATGTNHFAELRYSVHPVPRRQTNGVAIEHHMDQLTLHFGFQFDLSK